MLKKKAFRRIFFTTIIFFIVFVLLSIKKLEEPTNIYESNNYKTDYIENIWTLNDDNYVSKTSIYVNKELNVLEKVKVLIETMIEENNNNSLLPTYFNPILPRNTKILEVVLDKDLIKINFSKEFKNATEEQCEKMIEAIVYTLTDINGINGVEIYVNNELLKYIPNTSKVLPTILTKDIGINKIYNINGTNDILKVITYFLGNSKEINYVPVTSYLNTSKEKIEIIVENLTSIYSYDNSLIAPFDSNLKLVNYLLEDNKMFLEFNCFSCIEKDYLDLIVYSVFDNYEVDSIIFLENNQKILEKFRKDT